eukprot:g2084.t1
MSEGSTPSSSSLRVAGGAGNLQVDTGKGLKNDERGKEKADRNRIEKRPQSLDHVHLRLGVERATTTSLDNVMSQRMSSQELQVRFPMQKISLHFRSDLEGEMEPGGPLQSVENLFLLDYRRHWYSQGKVVMHISMCILFALVYSAGLFAIDLGELEVKAAEFNVTRSMVLQQATTKLTIASIFIIANIIIIIATHPKISKRFFEKRYTFWETLSCIEFLALFGLVFHVSGSDGNPMDTTNMMMIIMVLALPTCLLRARFLVSVTMMLVAIVYWAIITSVVYTDHGHGDKILPYTLILFLTATIYAFASHQSEMQSRQVFLSNYKLMCEHRQLQKKSEDLAGTISNMKRRLLVSAINGVMSENPAIGVMSTLARLQSQNLLMPEEEETFMHFLTSVPNANIFAPSVDHIANASDINSETLLQYGVLSTRHKNQAPDNLRIRSWKSSSFSPQGSKTLSKLVDDHSDLLALLRRAGIDWSFSAIDLEKITPGATLYSTALYLFSSFGICERLGIAKETLDAALTAFQDGYRESNPYHNASHAADVLHAVCCFLSGKTYGTSSARGVVAEELAKSRSIGSIMEISDNSTPPLFPTLTEIDVFAMMLAATVHDIDHPGFNNSFLISSASEIAIMYNDRSVLENHHLATAFRIMRSDNSNLLKSFSPATSKSLRATIIELVLATDLKEHFSFVGKMGDFMELQPTLRGAAEDGEGCHGMYTSPQTYDDKDKQRAMNMDKLLVMQIALKAADLGHGCKPWDQHYTWSMRVLEEFYHQGDEEYRYGLPIPLSNDRSKSEPSHVADAQCNFIDILVLPLWKLWGEYMNSTAWLQLLEENKEKWRQLAASDEGLKSIEESLAVEAKLHREKIDQKRKTGMEDLMNGRLARPSVDHRLKQVVSKAVNDAISSAL